MEQFLLQDQTVSILLDNKIQTWKIRGKYQMEKMMEKRLYSHSLFSEWAVCWCWGHYLYTNPPHPFSSQTILLKPRKHYAMLCAIVWAESTILTPEDSDQEATTLTIRMKKSVEICKNGLWIVKCKCNAKKMHRNLHHHHPDFAEKTANLSRTASPDAMNTLLQANISEGEEYYYVYRQTNSGTWGTWDWFTTPSFSIHDLLCLHKEV